MAMARSCRSTQTRVDPNVSPVMDALNRIVQTTGPDWLFMTACYLLIDPAARRYAYANAGHHFPLHYHADTRTADALESTSPLLGIDAKTTFKAEERSWKPGDTLVLFSDGIVEAENATEEIFGDDRLRALVEAHGHERPADLKQRIIDAVETFAQGVPYMDDVTLVVARL